jgi:hypothetical protein
MRRHLLRFLQIPAIGQVDGDPGRPEGVAADFRVDPGFLCAPLDHPEGIIPGEGLCRKPARFEDRPSGRGALFCHLEFRRFQCSDRGAPRDCDARAFRGACRLDLSRRLSGYRMTDRSRFLS